jgi:hypothetical protein
MKTIIMTVAVVILSTGVLLASKENPEIDKAFSNYKTSKPIMEKNEQKIPSLADLVVADTYSIPQVLHVLQLVRNGSVPAKIEDLQVLLDRHKKKTFIAKDPEYGRFVKAKDYEAMLCRELEALINEKKIQQNKAQHPTDGAVVPEKPKE